MSAVLWKRFFQSLSLMLMMWVALQPATTDAQTCATPGKDGAGGTLTGIKNAYYPGTTTTLTAGTSTVIALGAANAAGAQTAIASGDLLLIIQMQDATINVTNTSSYGDGTAGGGTGYSAANNTGRYEFIKATSAIPVTGGNLSFTGTGASSRLNNSYSNASYTTTTLQGQRRYQVVRVPQYTTATLSSTLTAAPWNGTSGGILAIDVSGVLTLGGTVSVNGLGFRPGAARQLAGDSGGATTDYRNVATKDYYGSKGEGIAGTPRYMYIASTGLVLNNTDEGYTSGSTGMGAPGNAGGGGTDGRSSANDQNSGGGGGANGGAGGRGGNSWSSNLAVGGFGGSAFAEASASRLVMGGGGGGGTRNNTDGVDAAGSGGAGGGMIIIRAGSISGTGTLSANGADAFNDTLNDGGGGGGAGGSILFWVKLGTLTGLTVNARGGEGGDAWRTQAPVSTPGERHGPGGGGGGGVIYVSTAVTASSVAGGGSGITTTANDVFGAVAGSTGTIATNLFASQIPGLYGGAICTLSTSSVDLVSFEATRYDRYVALQWETGHEANNLGFNIYREENGQRQLLTKSLIAGSALVAAASGAVLTGRTYSWWDASGNPDAQYWLEDVDLDGTLSLHGPIVAIGASYGKNDPLLQMQESATLETVGVSKDDTDLTVPVEPKAKPAKMSANLLFAQASVAAQSAAKISVKQSGWYRVTQQELAAAGFNVTSPQFLQLLVDGQQQPFILKSEKGGSFSVEFYGVGADTTWTDTRVYWLTVGSGPGTKIRTVQETATGIAAGSYEYTVERSDRTTYFSGLKNGDADNFFGAIVFYSGVDQAITLRNLDGGMAKEASIEVRLQGVSVAPHQVRASINGVILGDVTFYGQDEGIGRFTVSQASLKEGENHVTLIPQLGTTDASLAASIRVTYWRSYKAENGALRLTANGTEEVTIEGFQSGDLRVMDVTTANAPQEVAVTVKQQESGYSVTAVAPGKGKRTLLAFSGSSIKSAASISADRPSSLRQKGNGADLVILTTQALSASVEPLKALRQSQGLKVAVVDVEDIYDEFSFGQKTPQSVKDFLSYAKSNWSPAPRFVLLVGDATYDPRNYLGRGTNDLVPTKLLSTVQFETASDDWFVDFDGDSIPEVAIGRLPVRTPEEAATVVGKIVAYDRQPVSSSALLVNDRNDARNFQQASQSVRSLIPLATVVQVDRNLTDDATAKAAIMDNLNRGPKIVNFLGHGSTTIWNGYLMTGPDAASLTNAQGLSMFVLQTCLNGYYQDPTGDSLADTLLKNAQGGAVAVWASSGYTEAEGQVQIDREMMKSLFGGKGLTIGEAAMNAKGATGDLDVRRTWTLFGDPSMKLR